MDEDSLRRAARRVSAQHARHSAQPLRVRVTSESMRPLLRSGDALLVQPCSAAEVREGEVLTVQSGGNWVTHRLMEVSPQGWVLMGDAAPWADAPLPPEALVGRVRGLWREGTFQDWEAPPWEGRVQAAARRARRRYRVVRILQRKRYPPRGAAAFLLRVWLRAARRLW